MPGLVLGPLLRYVDAQRATVWVETDGPCEVSVLGHAARTFTVHGRHYGIVVVEGLAAGTGTPYTVTLDGEQVWPDPALSCPPSVIRTPASEGTVRVSFGSCRLTLPPNRDHSLTHGVDALHALALEGMADPRALPDLLFLCGDQVYADEATADVADLVVVETGPRPPQGEVASFEEYARLYEVSWSENSVRWLMSTVPTVMIFDDHDVRDDWNTSQVWRDRMAGAPWWRRRITAALASYWVYQHLGNLSPAEIRDDPLLRDLHAADGDGAEVLDTFAYGADQRPESNRWSFVRDLGRVRLLVIDSRCGRVTDPQRRAIVDEQEWAWIVEQARADVDHLLVGSSLPVLLPRPVSDVEGWNEAICAGTWGPRWVARGERIREALDLEHWASFHRSLGAMCTLLGDIATGRHGRPPHSVVILSGDVHHSYLIRALLPDDSAFLWQAVCSPLRNPLGGMLRWANLVAFWRSFEHVGRWLAARGRVALPPFDWQVEQGPWFDNALTTVEISGAQARIRFDRAVSRDDRDGLAELGSAELTGGPPGEETRERPRHAPVLDRSRHRLLLGHRPGHRLGAARRWLARRRDRAAS